MIGMSSRRFTMSAPSKLMDLMLRALITTSLSASTGSVLSGGCWTIKRGWTQQECLILPWQRGGWQSSQGWPLQLSDLPCCLDWKGIIAVCLSNSVLPPLHHWDLRQVGQQPPFPTANIHHHHHHYHHARNLTFWWTPCWPGQWCVSGHCTRCWRLWEASPEF